MATSKTADVSKATSPASKASNKKNKLDSSEIPTYAFLRLVIDGFEEFALQHYLTGKDSAERKKRAKEIEKFVSSFQKKVMKGNKMVGCPRGYCNCNEGSGCYLCIFCPVEDHY